MPDLPPVACPHCDTTLRPEEVAPHIWLCPCCASTWRDTDAIAEDAGATEAEDRHA